MKKFFAILCSVLCIGGAVALMQNNKEFISASAAAMPTETPANVVVVDDDTYAPSTRLWQGIPGVEVTAGGRLWSTFFTGGEKEPQSENYVVLSYSDDDGETWKDPFLVVEHPSADARAYDPSIWIDPLGRLWLTWCQAREYADMRTWAFVIENPDAEESALTEQVENTSPKMLCEGVKLNKFTLLANGDWLFFTASTTPTAITVHASTDNGANWTTRSVVSGNGLSVTEPLAFQTADGTVALYTRIEKNRGGGIGRAFSKDNGLTWSEYQSDLEAPLRGPSSRLMMMKLQSGNILLVNNESETARTNLKAYLSLDGGQTWAYSMMLDGRASVSYPDVTQDKEGYIYVTYDKGRYEEKEIRISKFTEQDIMDGFIHSEKGKARICVSVLGSTMDIVKVNTAFEKIQTVKIGTQTTNIRTSLPRKIEVVASDGNTYTLNGKWSSLNFNGEKAGTYQFTFSAAEDALRYKLYDARELLSVTVVVEGKEKKGCTSTMEYGAGALVGIVSAVLLNKKRKNKIGRKIR